MRGVNLTNTQNRAINDGAPGDTPEKEIRLFTATEAARILHVSRNAVYTLWRKKQLDYWCINGTMTTNLSAIRSFLQQMKNREET